MASAGTALPANQARAASRRPVMAQPARGPGAVRSPPRSPALVDRLAARQDLFGLLLDPGRDAVLVRRIQGLVEQPHPPVARHQHIGAFVALLLDPEEPLQEEELRRAERSLGGACRG